MMDESTTIPGSAETPSLQIKKRMSEF